MSVSLADFEQVRLLEHLKTSGLLDGFLDPLGNNQPAVMQTAGPIEMEQLEASQRCVQCRINGGEQQPYGDIGYTQRPMMINVFSKRVISDTLIAEGLAKSIQAWLLENFESESHCIISIEVLGCNGAFFAEESRVYFEIPLVVKFGR